MLVVTLVTIIIVPCGRVVVDMQALWVVCVRKDKLPEDYSGLSAYDHRNVDFPKPWPIHMSVTYMYKRLLPFVIHLGFLTVGFELGDNIRVLYVYIGLER